LQVLLSDPGLAVNVNTRADLAKAEDFIKHQTFL
jgi:GTP:adenosylcobinamide-phosphate guanylyltransferase